MSRFPSGLEGPPPARLLGVGGTESEILMTYAYRLAFQGVRDYAGSAWSGIVILTYCSFSVPFCALMLKGYFDTIPTGIDESGRMDGLLPFGTFWQLIMPFVRSGLAVTAFYTSLTAWGEVAFPSQFMSGEGNAAPSRSACRPSSVRTARSGA